MCFGQAESCQIANKAKTKNSQVILIAPPTKKYYSKTTDKHIKLINEWSKFLSGFPDKRKFVDFEEITENKDLFASDNLHLNALGQKKLSNHFINELKINV